MSKKINPGDPATGTTIDFAEFRDALIASQANFQTMMQTSLQELNQTLIRQLGNINPPPQDAVAARPHEQQDNPIAGQRRELANYRQQDIRWESGFKVEIPEFHGGIRGDLLIDWLVTVEEILDFKRVPADRQVPLVATRFRGHAASWWQQLKTTRSRAGKAPISSWDKLKKKLKGTFFHTTTTGLCILGYKI